MPTEVVRQNDFSFGEISPEYAASGNVEAVRRSLKRGRNVRLRNSYGFSVRYGSRWVATASGIGAVANIVTSLGDEYEAVLRNGGLDIYDENGGLIQSVSGAPWTTSNVQGVSWLVREDELYIAHNDFWPRLLTFDGATWSLGLYAFASGSGGSAAQLYYRFANKGITLTPSGRTGSITLTASAAVFESGHVGLRFRYGGDGDSLKEVEITAVTSSVLASATVIDELPPTFAFDVADASGFREGESVEGKTSTAKGVITNITGDTLTVIMTSGFEGFTDTSGSEEDIIGPNTRSKIQTATQASAGPAASAAWDEAVFSAVHGYPGCVFERSGRLGFTDFPDIPDGGALSAPADSTNFDISGGDANAAIFFRLGQQNGQRIRFGISAANLILLTTKAVYYVPEDLGTPLSGNTFAANLIAPIGASGAYPVVVEEGVAFIESGGNRMIGVFSTGDFSSPWRTIDMTERCAHLVSTPVSLAMTAGDESSPERYIFALNSDGTVLCVFYKTTDSRIGGVLWETDGSYIAMASRKGIIYALCERSIGGSTVYLLERLDANAKLDACSLFSTATGADYLALEDGSSLDLDGTSGALLTDFSAIPQLAGQEVAVVRGTQYLGTYTVSAAGFLSGIDVDDGEFQAGFHFDMDVLLWPPEPQSPAFRGAISQKRKISHISVRVQESGSYQVGVNGQTLAQRSAYDQGDDIDDDPPLRSEARRFPVFCPIGYEPVPEIARPIPVPVSILSVECEVVF